MFPRNIGFTIYSLHKVFNRFCFEVTIGVVLVNSCSLDLSRHVSQMCQENNIILFDLGFIDINKRSIGSIVGTKGLRVKLRDEGVSLKLVSQSQVGFKLILNTVQTVVEWKNLKKMDWTRGGETHMGVSYAVTATQLHCFYVNSMKDVSGFFSDRHFWKRETHCLL